MTKQQQTEQQNAIVKLREWIKPGDTITTVLRHVSRSGMQRAVDPLICQDGQPMSIAWLVARAIGSRIDRNHGGVIVGGYGTDAGFELVYHLAYTLWPDGFGCIGDGCPSNAHVNGDRDYSPHVFTPHNDGARNHAHWHKEPGYALRHRWL